MRPKTTRRGLTVIELVIALALIVVCSLKVALLIRATSDAHGRETKSMALEDQARRLLDRICYSIAGAGLETMTPTAGLPFFATNVEYRVCLGAADGQPVWGPVQSIGLGEEPSQLRWGNAVGEAEERFVVWCNTVSAFAEQELENGVDDNSNELADECGISFTMWQEAVCIVLTLERVNQDGTVLQETVQTVITPRN